MTGSYGLIFRRLLYTSTQTGSHYQYAILEFIYSLCYVYVLPLLAQKKYLMLDE